MAAYPRCPVMPLLRHHLARFSAKNFTIDSNHVSPLRWPSHGAKSGLTRCKSGGPSANPWRVLCWASAKPREAQAPSPPALCAPVTGGETHSAAQPSRPSIAPDAQQKKIRMALANSRELHATPLQTRKRAIHLQPDISAIPLATKHLRPDKSTVPS